MKVLILGLPSVGNALARSFKKRYPEDTFIALDTYYRKADKLRYFYHLLNTDIVYSINGTASFESGTMKLAMKLGKKLIMHWVGTDILKAQQAKKDNRWNAELVDYAHHFSQTDRTERELLELGIQSERQQCYIVKDIFQPVAFPPEFAVVTYISEHRAKFYGIDFLIKVAQQTPQIQYRVIGKKSYDKTVPPNIHFIGWVDDVKKEIEKSVVFLRYTVHDGLPGTLLEAQAMGRYIAYRFPHPFAKQVEHPADFIEWIKKIQSQFRSGTLNINKSAVKYIDNNFREQHTLRGLYKTFGRLLND